MKPDIRGPGSEKAPYRLNKDNVLEYDVQLEAGKKMDVEIRWSMEYPKNEEVEFREYWAVLYEKSIFYSRIYLFYIFIFVACLSNVHAPEA